MTESLSIPQARKLVLLSQGLPSAKQTGTALKATLNAIEHLGYVQIDTISVIQRAHHHTLWNRAPRYKPAHLDQLVDAKQVFEYWSHAAAYLPMRDYRFTLLRKQAIASGALRHWYSPDLRLMNSVLDRIKAEGPLMAKDFGDHGRKMSAWQSKPSKRALECLFMQGDLMISERANFHKVYDLTERVVPAGIDTTVPSRDEQSRFLINKYLQVNGIGNAEEISYLLKNTKPLVTSVMADMLSAGEIIKVAIGKNANSKSYYAQPSSLALLSRPLARKKIKILSPFDNFLIQRQRIQRLFNFEYLIECYVPEKKRQHGYFCLPILWQGELVARMDCKADKKTSTLHIHRLIAEPSLKDIDSFATALATELSAFLSFNNCNKLILHKTTPASIRPTLRAIITQG